MVSLDNIPLGPGVYLMKDKDQNILYIGKSKSLIKRVKSYFQSSYHSSKISEMLKLVCDIEYRATESEVDALILESLLIKQYQPKYNTRQKDSKSFPYWVITKDFFPRVFLTHLATCSPIENFELFGPFTDAKGLKRAFKLLQKIFRFRTCNLTLQESGPKKRPCLLAAIGDCSAPCGKRISHEKYCQDIQGLRSFLQGKHRSLVKQLTKEMKVAAKNCEFESAIKIRDQIQAIQNLDRHGQQSDFIPGTLLNLDMQKSMIALQENLKLSRLPYIIEGIDVAHHQGKEAVASLVTFVDGIPCPKRYRRYRIQGSYTQNDYACIQEIIYRRFQEKDCKQPLPDILLIDGGKGQLEAALHTLQQIKIVIPAIVALAKKHEEIYVVDQPTPLHLPSNSACHHLLCYVRDEAHRFAQSYHHLIKRKKIRPGE